MHKSRWVLVLQRSAFSESMGGELSMGMSHGAEPGTVWRPPPRKRGIFLLKRLAEVGQAGVRVRPLGGNRAGEVRLGRFLHNPRVTPHEMVATASDRSGTGPLKPPSYRARLSCPSSRPTRSMRRPVWSRCTGGC